MHVAFASRAPWNAVETFAKDETYRVSSVVLSPDELPSRLSSLLPDIVVLNFAEDEILDAIGRINKAGLRVIIVPFCVAPSPNFLVNLMRLGVDDVLMDEDAPALNRIVLGLTGKSSANPQDRTKCAKRIAFLASKGGNGATFLLSNFAAALANQTDGRVLLVDLSIPFGDIDMYLSPNKVDHDILDFIQQIDRLDRALHEAMVHHVNDKLDLIPSPATMDRVVRIGSGDVARLIDRVDNLYDFVLFDLGCSVDQVGLPIIESADQVVIVSRPDLPSARRTGQLIRLLSELDFSTEKLIVVSNEFGVKTGFDPSEFERATALAIHRRIPDAGSAVTAALIQSKPAIELAPKSAFAKAIGKWIAELSGNSNKGRRLWAIFGSN